MVAGQIPVVTIYEDEVVFAFLDIAPVSNGHTLVIPKRHFEKLHDCPCEILAQLGFRLGNIAKAVETAMSSEGYNVLCNNGSSAGQLVEHLHFHIIPRNAGDGLFGHWPAHKYPEGEIEIIADKIRKSL
jgi:histidine triad (HIT) family protein